MNTAEIIRETVEKAQPGTFVHASRLVGPPRAVESELSRLAAKGVLQRARKGLYWKGRESRFGTTRPDPVAVAFEVAGDRGIGYAGASASHALGLSTQIPPRQELAIVGPAPSGVAGVTFQRRNNFERLKLRPLEVALLEVLRAWPYGVEVADEELADRIRQLADEGSIDISRVAAAAQREPGRVRERFHSLLLGRRVTGETAAPGSVQS